VPGVVYLGDRVPVAYKYGDLALQVGGVSRIGTIKYGLESRGTQARAGLRWREPAATVNYRPENGLKTILRRKKKWSLVPDGCLTPRRIGRLTVGRNITLTLTVALSSYDSPYKN
jgi:hypothetical protein